MKNLISEAYIVKFYTKVLKKLKRRHTNEEGAVIGEFNPDPLLKSILYVVVFTDGAIKNILLVQ